MTGHASRPARRGLLAAAAGTLLALAASVGLAPTASAVGELSATGEASFSDVASCSSTADNLLVTVVVDESLSLRSTDPDDGRVDAILTALDSLEQLGSTTELSVEANLSVFGETFTELVGWGPVAGDHAQALRDAATDQLPDRDTSNLTDYRQALQGAQGSLDARAQELGTTSCKLMLWLTDGKLDVDGRGDRPATDAARVDLCEPGGIIDSARADGVAVIALGLLTSEGQGAVTPLDRERLQAIAEGTGGAESCGTVPVGDSVTNGAFLNADDAGALNRLFAQTVALIGGASGGRSVVCPGDGCVDGRLPIPVDDGVGGFRLVLEQTDGAPAPQLVAPDGETVVLDSAVTEVAGVPVSVLTSSSLLSVDVRDADSAVGTWTLLTDPASTTVIDLYYFWGISLVAQAPTGILVGDSSELRIVAQDATGSPVDLAALGSVTLDLTIDGAPAQVSLDDGAWTTQIDVPVTDAVSALAVAGRATAVTAPNGIALGPVAIEQRLETEFPPSFPTVAPAQIELGRLAEATTTSVPLTLTGADRGPTRVCFAPGEVTAPERAGSVTLASTQECVELEAGASAEVTVDFAAQDAADGRIEGVLPVQLFGVDPGDPIELDVAVSGTMVRPVDEGTRVLLVAGFIALALAIAWAAAAISRRVLNRFDLSNQARFAQVPVRVTGAGPTPTNGQSALILAEKLDFVPRRGSRTAAMTIGPARYSIRYPLNPLARAEPLVTGTSGQVPITDVVTTVARPAHRQVRLPGSVGLVVITARPDDGAPDDAIDGTLVVVIDPGKTGDLRAIVAERLSQLNGVRWGDEVARAHQEWAAIRTAAPAATSGSTAGGRGSRNGGGSASGASGAPGDTPDGPPARRTPGSDPQRPGDGPPPRRTSSDTGTGTGSGSTPPPRRGAPDMPPPRRSTSPGPDDPPPPRR